MMSKKHTSDLIGQRNQRIEKVDQLISMGINPYPAKGDRSNRNEQILNDFGSYKDQEVKVVGRIMTWRKHGELNFIDLQDDTGRIQLYLRLSDMKDTDVGSQTLGPDDFYLLDIGDHIEAKGIVTKTKSGEISVLVDTIKLLSKSIRPLPNKWDGIVDKEARYRRRYLDMTMNPEIRERFKRRAIFWQAVRDFLNDNGFYEINTPILEHTTGGADARPFETHYDALGENFYLRISQELPLKRLLGAGFEKVYDLGPRFRNEGFSDEHLPEHIAMEWYWAYSDFRDGMKLTEDLFKYTLKETYGTLNFKIKDFEIDLDKEWVEIDFATIIKEKFDIDIFEDPLEKMRDALAKHSDLENEDLVMNRSRLADGLWKLIRPTITGPVFLTGVPKFLSPLSKTNQEDPRKTDRFHPIIAGSELANAFSELNDPQDQLDRFVDQQSLRESGDDEAHMLDIDFVEMLEYGMPPAVGFGMSERLFWIFEGVSAREGVPFPPMRRGLDETTKEIYSDILKKEKKVVKSDQVGKTNDLDPNNPEELKIVMVLNKDLKGWKLTNTVGHLSAYLGSKVGEDITSRDRFEIKEGTLPANSKMPIIALTGTDQQLHNLTKRLEEEKTIPYLTYIEEMVDLLTDDQVADALKKKDFSELTVYGVGMFGSKETVDQLTKKFSLWK